MDDGTRVRRGPAVGGAALRLRPILHTATLRVPEGDGSFLEVFHACRVTSMAQAFDSLSSRIGRVRAAASTIRPGIDPGDPVVVAVLGAVSAERLHRTGDLPGGPLSTAAVLHIVQRRG